MPKPRDMHETFVTETDMRPETHSFKSEERR